MSSVGRLPFTALTIATARYLSAVLVVVLLLKTGNAIGQENGTMITLNEAVKIALEKNPALRAAVHASEAARIRVRKSRAGLLPRADVQLNYARLDPGTVRRGNVFVEPARALVETFGSGDPNDVRPAAYSNSFSTALQIVQPIYNGGANWAALSIAQAQETSDEKNREDTKQQVILDVKVRYLRVLQAKELVFLAQKTLDSSIEHLRKSKNMLEVGLRDRTDVLRWEVEKSNQEGDLITAENNHEVAFAALKHAMGVPYKQYFEIEPLPLDPEPLSQNLDEQIGITMAKHPGLLALTASLDAQRAGVRLAAAALQPKINFLYQLSWEENNTLAPDSFVSWRAGVSVQLPVFHSFRNIAGIQEAKVEVSRFEETKRDAESALTLAVIRARLSVESSVKRFQIATKALEQARENLRILNNTYSVGIATNLDVLDAEVVYTKSEAGLIRSRYDYWIARAELDRAMGILTE